MFTEVEVDECGHQRGRGNRALCDITEDQNSVFSLTLTLKSEAEQKGGQIHCLLTSFFDQVALNK